MKKLVAIFFFLALGFSVSIAQSFQPLHPSSHVIGKPFPIVLEAFSDGELDRFYSSETAMVFSGATPNSEIVKIKKGRGMAGVMSSQSGSMQINSSEFNTSIPENLTPSTPHHGVVSGSQVWSAGSMHVVSSDLEIESTASLTIEQGCWVLLDSAVNIQVNGTLNVLGAANNPVVFTSNSPDIFWGGVTVSLTNATFNYCLFTNGGGDGSQAFGHSNSQATVKSASGTVQMNNCFIFDCAGKGIGADNGTIGFSNGAISRCDMGGEFLGSIANITASHILDIPNDDGLFIDDDNDGFYFGGASVQSNDPSVIDSCVFMFGKDDAIDHNGAILEVKNSWVEGFENEGIAASNNNSVFVYNSLFKNCEQGIEAGYGSPSVTVDHCVMIENDNGLRFGDWYNWGCTGSITCTNSIMFDNDDNVYNYDFLTEAAVNGAIDLTHSITNDSEYNSNTGCLSGTPNFNSNYLLEVGSPGIGVANDGSNMGLVSSLSTHIAEASSIGRPLISVSVYSVGGRLVYHQATSVYNPNVVQQLSTGIYIVEKNFGDYKTQHKQAILR